MTGLTDLPFDISNQEFDREQIGGAAPGECVTEYPKTVHPGRRIDEDEVARSGLIVERRIVGDNRIGLDENLRIVDSAIDAWRGALLITPDDPDVRTDLGLRRVPVPALDPEARRC